jgi:hypothetical protein
MNEINNVFVGTGGTDVITLSVYNRDESYDENTFKSNHMVTSYIPGEKLPIIPPPIPEEGADPAAPRPQTAPVNLGNIKGLSILQKNNRQEYRIE